MEAEVIYDQVGVPSLQLRPHKFSQGFEVSRDQQTLVGEHIKLISVLPQDAEAIKTGRIDLLQEKYVALAPDIGSFIIKSAAVMSGGELDQTVGVNGMIVVERGLVMHIPELAIVREDSVIKALANRALGANVSPASSLALLTREC